MKDWRENMNENIEECLNCNNKECSPNLNKESQE